MITQTDMAAALANPHSASISRQDVLQSFEAVFIGELLGGLWEAMSEEWGSGSGGGAGKQIYGMWFKQTLAEAMAQSGGIGIATQLKPWVEESAAGEGLPSDEIRAGSGGRWNPLKISGKEPIKTMEPCAALSCRRFQAVSGSSDPFVLDPVPWVKEADP